VRVNGVEHDLLKRAAGLGGALAASERPALEALLRRLLDHVDVQPDERSPAPSVVVLTSTGRSTA
jgi:hypothetical protein